MRFIVTYLILFGISNSFAQFPNFEISGLSRALADNSFLDQNDTLNDDVKQDFNLIFDFAIKGKLNKQINFYSELRLGNSLEIFDTSSSYLNLRRILIYGKLSKNSSFEIGDVDLKMTPFTIWNFYEEGAINENRLSKDYRSIQRYENFNNGNYWRRQGLVIKAFKPIFKDDTISFKSFGTREQESNEISTPDIFLYGSEFKLQLNKITFGLNHIDLFSNNKGINLDTNINNHVLTSNLDLKFKKLKLSCEFGFSCFTNTRNNFDSKWIVGEFLHTNLLLDISNNLSFSVDFRAVSDDFSSPGSQSKRINYSLPPNLFPITNNTSEIRDISFSDIIYGISFFRSNSFYNRNIDYNLDEFNPFFGVAEPYGLVTPNRRGFDFNLGFSDSLKIISFNSRFSFLNDLVGEGINKNRNYSIYVISIDFKINKILSLDNKILLTAGISNSSSKREHPVNLNVQNVDLDCNIFDLGLEFEVLKNLSFLSSYKRLFSSGIDYLPIRDNDFTINSFVAFQCNLVHQINSFGVAYDFNRKSSILLNYQMLNFKDNLSNNEFGINQFFVLVQIKF